MPTPREVADYFLAKADEDAGDLISKLKIQKLLYYAQGFHLALFDKPLFNEKICAWTHGPVVPSVFYDFKGYDQSGLPKPEAAPEFDANTTELLDEVYKVFGQYSAWKLRNLTHDEPPWKEAKLNQEISQEALRSYFKTQLIRE